MRAKGNTEEGGFHANDCVHVYSKYHESNSNPNVQSILGLQLLSS